jgi:hypothetical protein
MKNSYVWNVIIIKLLLASELISNSKSVYMPKNLVEDNEELPQTTPINILPNNLLTLM